MADTTTTSSITKTATATSSKAAKAADDSVAQQTVDLNTDNELAAIAANQETIDSTPVINPLEPAG